MIPHDPWRFVFTRQRRTSVTPHACAMQPRGVKGASASNTSLIDPIPRLAEVRAEAVEDFAQKYRA